MTSGGRYGRNLYLEERSFVPVLCIQGCMHSAAVFAFSLLSSRAVTERDTAHRATLIARIPMSYMRPLGPAQSNYVPLPVSRRCRYAPARGCASPLHSHANAVALPPLSSRIASRLVQPTMQPLGHVGSSTGGGAASPKDHWHSCVAKLGETRNGTPSSLKSSWAGILHELRHMPLQEDSCRNLHFSTTSPPISPSARRLREAGPTRNPNAKGATTEVSAGA